MLKAKRKKLKKKFQSKDKIWRIEAVIHDGNWYDIKKWRRVARVKKEDLLKWIDENEDILIKSDLGSYRVGYDEIIKWYEQEDIDVEQSIIPNNFPPKLWGNTTETDVFLNAPRRRVGTVSFVAENRDLLQKCIKILKGTGKIMPDIDGRYKAHGLSAIYMRNLLSKGLTKRELESLDIKTRAVLMQRELADLPEKWLEEAIDFYANTFAPQALRSSMSTISIYLADGHDIHSQTIIWIITAMKKFNEDASVPFSGYLSAVLRHWPYNLPDEHLGKELSRFQRERKRAIDLAEAQGHERNNVPISVIAEIMDMPMKHYIILNSEHENWLAERNATTLTWQDSANEKKGKLVGIRRPTKADKRKLFKLSIATVKTAVDTEEWDLAYDVISQIDANNIDEDIGERLSESFLAKFEEYLGDFRKA